MHFYGWKAGLKTGMYYLRTKSMMQLSSLDKNALTEPLEIPQNKDVEAKEVSQIV